MWCQTISLEMFPSMAEFSCTNYVSHNHNYVYKHLCVSRVPYHVLAQWRQVVHLPEVDLGLLHGLHAGVNGSHQSLLC